MIKGALSSSFFKVFLHAVFFLTLQPMDYSHSHCYNVQLCCHQSKKQEESGCEQKWEWYKEIQYLCWFEGIVPCTGRSWNMVGCCCHHMSIIFLFPFVLFFVSFSCRIPVNTGFNHNCCHCFLSQHKRNILLFFALFTLFLSLCKVPKASFYKVLKEKMKHKKDEKEEEDKGV